MSYLNLEEMIKAGVHFGHQVQRWNPKMKPYVYALQGGIHIINLEKTLLMADKALQFIEDITSEGGSLIFVGTKKQAAEVIKEEAEKRKQFYVTKRWLGGTLTNFQTIKLRIDRMRRIDQMKERGDLDRYSKKERGKIEKEREKLNEYLGGIRDMKNVPQAMFVVDINKESIAVAEANKLRIPIIAIVDTNTNPDLIDYKIPGNDDSTRAIRFFVEKVGEACERGAKKWKQKIRHQELESLKGDGKTKISVKKDDEDIVQNVGSSSVVQVFRSRKLVAAGMAEDVEIAMEVEDENLKGKDKSSQPSSAAKESIKSSNENKE